MTHGLDTQSPTWRAIEQYAQRQVAGLREKNDGFSQDAIATAALRGRIAVWKEVLALGHAPNPAIPADDGAASGY